MSASTNTPRTKRKHPLKIAGEVQMKKVQHDMTVLRRTNEKLVEALRDMIELVIDEAARHPASPGARMVENARSLLRELGKSEQANSNAKQGD